jgi:hypothetical protein
LVCTPALEQPVAGTMSFTLFQRDIFFGFTRRAHGRYFLDTYRSPVGMSYFFGRLEVLISKSRVRRISHT